MPWIDMREPKKKPILELFEQQYLRHAALREVETPHAVDPKPQAAPQLSAAGKLPPARYDWQTLGRRVQLAQEVPPRQLPVAGRLQGRRLPEHFRHAARGKGHEEGCPAPAPHGRLGNFCGAGGTLDGALQLHVHDGIVVLNNEANRDRGMEQEERSSS